MNTLNEDEIDTILDLIVIVIFASFLLGSMVIMTQHMAKRVSIYTPADKVVISSEEHERDDPMWFTGYQAYMFAWHMDELSDQSISWITLNSGAKIDDDDYRNDITMSRKKINDANIASSFIPLRNRYIIGTGFAEGSNVKKVINQSSLGDLFKLYRGKAENSHGEKLMYHLSLTDKYTRYSALGADINTGGKIFSWVLEPRFH